MISRLLLVGLVGVLGISLPDGADLGKGLPQARAGAMVCACGRETVTFEPIAVDDSVDRIADELNRQSEGLDLPMTPTARVAAIAQPVEDESVDVVDTLFAENWVWAVPSDEAIASEVVSAPSVASDVRGETPAKPVASDAVDQLFAENRVWAVPTEEAIASDPVHTLFTENRVWAESADEAIASTTAPAREPRPRFEPIEVADGLSSVADELNRTSEGQPATGDAEPTLGSALRLTRDAAVAWMNVLTKTVTTTEDTTR